jgi:hypothetical protein
VNQEMSHESSTMNIINRTLRLSSCVSMKVEDDGVESEHSSESGCRMDSRPANSNRILSIYGIGSTKLLELFQGC